MKQLGNLAIVCARRQDVLLQILSGKAVVFVGAGPERRSIEVEWQDDAEVLTLIHELNYGQFRERT